MGRLFPQSDDKDRIPSLDGLRAVSIGLVLFSHLLGTRNFFGRGVLAVTGDLGNLGVRCFFVISGFLITKLLLRELEETGAISLKRFYLRRSFRIFPAFYVCLGAIAVLHGLGFVALNRYDLITAGTYTVNYRSALERSWNVGHMWSLAVEEQFYLIWPAILCAVGRRRALMVSLLVVLAVPFVRYGTRIWFPEDARLIKWAFHTVCDSLATGCLLAGLDGWLRRCRGYLACLRSNFILLVPIAVVVVNQALFAGRPRFSDLVAQSMMNCGIAVFLHHCIVFPGQWSGRALNLRPLIVIGALSYSLYLWQQLFLNHYSTSVFCAFPLNIVLALAMAFLSFLFVEKPFLKLRKSAEERLLDRSVGIVATPASHSS